MNKLTLLAGLATASMIATSANAVLLGSAGGTAILDGPGGCGSITGGTTTTSPVINVTPGMVMTANDLSITVTGLNHSWQGDLQITLLGPGGQQFSLVDQLGGGDGLCGSAADFSFATITFANGGPALAAGLITGSVASGLSNNPGSTWNAAQLTVLPGTGANIGGQWQLAIHDVSGADVGSYTGWSMNGSAAVPGPASLALLGVAGLAARRRRA